jgi:hypothetical protein
MLQDGNEAQDDHSPQGPVNEELWRAACRLCTGERELLGREIGGMPGTLTDHYMRLVLEHAQQFMRSKGFEAWGLLDPCANNGRALFAAVAYGASYARGWEYQKGDGLKMMYHDTSKQLEALGMDPKKITLAFGIDAAQLLRFTMHQSVNGSKFLYMLCEGVSDSWQRKSSVGHPRVPHTNFCPAHSKEGYLIRPSRRPAEPVST